jgi:hypothetical protein
MYSSNPKLQTTGAATLAVVFDSVAQPQAAVDLDRVIGRVIESHRVGRRVIDVLSRRGWQVAGTVEHGECGHRFTVIEMAREDITESAARADAAQAGADPGTVAFRAGHTRDYGMASQQGAHAVARVVTASAQALDARLPPHAPDRGQALVAVGAGMGFFDCVKARGTLTLPPRDIAIWGHIGQETTQTINRALRDLANGLFPEAAEGDVRESAQVAVLAACGLDLSGA